MWHSTIIGNVGDNAELKTLGEGKQVLGFSVGIKTGRENTEWAQISVWGNYGAMIADSVKKGSRVTIVGRVTGVDAYQKRDGGFGKSVKISADSVEIHRGKEDASSQQSMNAPRRQPPQQQQQRQAPQQQWGAAQPQQPATQQPSPDQGQWGSAPQQQQQQPQQQQQWGAAPSTGQNGSDPIPF